MNFHKVLPEAFWNFFQFTLLQYLSVWSMYFWMGRAYMDPKGIMNPYKVMPDALERAGNVDVFQLMILLLLFLFTILFYV